MLSVVEKTSTGTIYQAEKTYPFPDVDILTLLLGERSFKAACLGLSSRHGWLISKPT